MSATGRGRHVCGDAGGRNVATGTPCGQTTAKGRLCVWHSRSPEGRRDLALRGGVASRMMRALPSTYAVPEFTKPESIIAFAHELARLALTEDVDPRRVAEARGAAGLALSGFTALTQARLVEALSKIEHGAAAVMLLNRLQDGPSAGRGRPLPGRVVSLPTPGGDAS